MARNELDEFSRDLLALAVDFEKGKHAKKFMKKEASKLTKKNKQKAKDKGLNKEFDGELMVSVK